VTEFQVGILVIVACFIPEMVAPPFPISVEIGLGS